MYRVKLDIFEGPFDLLLFLIRKHEVDIYDIPIHMITAQFLEYIEVMKLLDLEVAGQFIEVVAILMNIKARLLLPAPHGISEDELEDPRTELVERLLEYKRFKEAAFEMSTFEAERRKLYARKYFTSPEKNDEVPAGEYLQDVSLFDLLLAFKTALDKMPKVTYHEVKKTDVSVEEQTEYLMQRLAPGKILLFSELVSEINEKIVLIVTFLAVLNLAKNRKIIIRQSAVFDDIRIKLAA